MPYKDPQKRMEYNTKAYQERKKLLASVPTLKKEIERLKKLCVKLSQQ